MSAFYCSPRHVGVVARWASQNMAMIAKPTEIARSIAIENIISMNNRYQHRAWKEWWEDDYTMDDYIKEAKEEAEKDQFDDQMRPWDDAQICQLAKCIDYQCCEHDSWPQSRAAEILAAVVKKTENATTDRDPVWKI